MQMQSKEHIPKKRNPSEKMIIVTGGAGFIGSATVRYLNDLGISQIAIVDDLGSSDKWKNLVGKRFTEIVSIKDCFAWLQGREKDIGAIIHLGASANTVEADADFLLENNYRFTVKLAEYALKHNHRFIYASSAATYGAGLEGFSDDHARLELLHPLNMYGYSKHLFDLWAKSQGVLDQIVGLKYFNVFGPNEKHKGRMSSAITKMLPSALQDGCIQLFKSSDLAQYGHGEQKRDFIYVKDVVKMTCAFLDNSAGGIFNIGSAAASTWNALAHAVFKGLQRPAKITYVDMPQDLVGKYQNFTLADTSKAQRAL